MASLFKRSRSKVWQASYYVKDTITGDLREIRKSTGMTNRKQAMQIAVELERSAQGVIASDSPQAENIDALLTQMRQEIALEKFTVLSARRYLNEITELVTGEKLETFTIKSWCDEWLTRKARDSSKATMARYKGHVKAFLAWLGDTKAQKPLEAITTTDAEKWKRSLLGTGIVGKTVLSYLKDMGQIYRAAIRDGLVSFNPFAACETPDTSDSQERKPFTAEEVERLIAAAPTEQWRGMILAAAFTGLRLGDVARLKWLSVNLETKMIELMPSKTKRKKKTVSIPIHPDLLAYLSAAPVADDSPDAFVFPELAQLGIGSRAGLSQSFNRIMEAAKVDRGKPSRVVTDDDDEPKGKGRVTYERGFHSLRHTFTTWLRTAGVSEEDRMALTGHSTRDSHSIYSHADESILRGAMDKLTGLKEPKK